MWFVTQAHVFFFESHFGRLEGVGNAVASVTWLSHPCFMRSASLGTLPVLLFICGCVPLRVGRQYEGTTMEVSCALW